MPLADLETSMLHAQPHPTTSVPAFPLMAYKTTPKLFAPVPAREQMFTVTMSSVTMDGSNLWREPVEVAFGQLMEGIRLAELRGKSEMVICNIALDTIAGERDATIVVEAQEEIEDIIEDVSKRLGREMPECRLNLRAGEFDIRCYLGREKPSDYVFEDDMISDSR